MLAITGVYPGIAVAVYNAPQETTLGNPAKLVIAGGPLGEVPVNCMFRRNTRELGNGAEGRGWNGRRLEAEASGVVIL